MHIVITFFIAFLAFPICAQWSAGFGVAYHAEPDWNRGFNNAEMELYRLPILLNNAADPMLRAAFSGTIALTANYQIKPKII